MASPKTKKSPMAKNALPPGRRDGSNAKPRPRPTRSRHLYS
ncbi:MAG: endonuclease III, partial [Mesorhizobium sp.]